MTRILFHTDSKNRTGAVYLIDETGTRSFINENDLQYISIKVYQNAFRCCTRGNADRLNLFQRKVKEFFFGL